MPVFCWMRLDLVFLVGTSTSGGVFWDVCGLIIIFGRLFSIGWGCVPLFLLMDGLVFLSFYLFGIGCPAL